MRSQAETRGALDIRVTGSRAGVRIKGMPEVTLDPAEARDLAAALLAAATQAEAAE